MKKRKYKYYIADYKKFEESILKTFLIIFIFVLIFIDFKFSIEKNTRKIITEEYIVQNGDTLWQIAKSVDDTDPREKIEEIKKDNNLNDVNLIVGQVLKIKKNA